MYRIILFSALLFGLVACNNEQQHPTEKENSTVDTSVNSSGLSNERPAREQMIELSPSPLLQAIQLASNTASLEDLLAQKGETTSLCKNENSSVLWADFELKDSCIDVAFHLVGQYTYVLAKKTLSEENYVTGLFVLNEKGDLLDRLDVAGSYKIRDEFTNEKGEVFSRIVDVNIQTMYNPSQQYFRVQTSSRSEIEALKQVDKKMEMVNYVFNQGEKKFQFID
ncbi:MAG: hypothetical protein MK212_12230 [Saprospiraceae bacterium]|nr:hypothetical protein [Saprospiraceae bacterium]